jgi:hypothetical protein
MTLNGKLATQVVAGLLLIGLGCVFHYGLSTLGWPGDWRSPSNRAVTAIAILFFGGGIFWKWWRFYSAWTNEGGEVTPKA